MRSVAIYQEAVKIIERDGVEGFHACSRIVGVEMAFVILIAALRRNYGSMNTFPSVLEIDKQVNDLLKKELPDIFASFEKTHDLFYTPKLYFCDSFAAFTVCYKGRVWKTREHAYQASKFTDESIVEKIFQAGSPYEAKEIAHDPNNENAKRSDWSDELKEVVMEELIDLQCEQHPIFRRKLLQTDSVTLIEDSDTDSYWGRGPNWRGKNRLGFLLMKVRDRRLAKERGMSQI